MRFVNRLSVFVLMLLFVVFAATAVHAAPAKILKLGYAEADDPCISYFHAGAVVFKAWVENNSNGQIEVQLFPNCALGNNREMMEAVQMGSIQATICFASVNSIFLPKLNFIFTPYILPNIESAWNLLDSPYMEKLLSTMTTKYGLRPIALAGDGGFRCFSANTPIRSPKDLKGLKIRVPESKALLTMVKALGATPTTIAWNEVYTSLQTGVADGQEVDLPSFISIKLYETQKYVTLDKHTYSMNALYINDKWFSDLSPELQDAVLEAGRMTSTAMRGFTAMRLALSVSEMREKGLTVYTPNEEEMQQFRDMSQKPVIEFMKKEYGEEAFEEFMTAVKAAIKAAGR